MPGEEDEVAVFFGEIGCRQRLILLPAVTVVAVGGRSPCHQFRAKVAVDAGHTGLLVDIGGERVIFDAVRPQAVTAVSVRGTVIPVKVMLKAAVIIGAHRVAVMAVQALAVGRAADKGMGDGLAAGKFQMTGGAAGTAPGFRIAVAGGVKVAAQAAAPQHVVGQAGQRGDLLLLGHGNEGGEILLGPEGAANDVDLVFHGEMEAVVHPGHLLRVTGATTLFHMVGMGRETDQAGMRLIGGQSRRVTAMAPGAGDCPMPWVEVLVVAVGTALLPGQGRCRRGPVRLLASAGGKQQNYTEQQRGTHARQITRNGGRVQKNLPSSAQGIGAFSCIFSPFFSWKITGSCYIVPP